MAAEHPEELLTVEAVLAGRASYDDLTSAEDQVAVRAEWDVRIARKIADLDMTAELEARGTPYYSADAEGNVIEHIPGVGARPYAGPAGDQRATGEPRGDGQTDPRTQRAGGARHTGVDGVGPTASP